MLLLKKITLTDFLSHENTVIEFKQNDNILLDGASGAGKSSIFEAIIWALYGQSRSDNRNIIRKGKDRASVEIELYESEVGASDKIYVIERSTNSSGKHTVEIYSNIDGAPRKALPLSGVREAQLWIDKELIGASYILFVNSVAYVQGNMDSFVSQSAPKRKELLLEIVKAENYGRYYDQAKKTLESLENDRSVSIGQITEMESRFNMLKERIGDRAILEKVLSDTNTDLKDIGPRIKGLEEKNAAFATQKKMIHVLEDAISRTVEGNKKLIDIILNKKNKLSKKEVLSESLTELPKLSETLNELSSELESKKYTLSKASEIESSRNEVIRREPRVIDRSLDIAKLEEKKAKIRLQPVCPSGPECPFFTEDIDLQISAVDNEINDILDKTILEDKQYALWKNEVSKLPSSVDMKSIIDSINVVESEIKRVNTEIDILKSYENSLLEINEIEKEIPGLEATLFENLKQIDELNSNKKSVVDALGLSGSDSIEKELISLRETQEGLNRALAKVNSDIEVLNKDEAEITDLENRIVEIKVNELRGIDDKIGKVELVKSAFGSKGVETLVIDFLLPKLEDRINEVLSKLSDFRVRLDTQKPSADGETMIEGLFITILDASGNEMPFESYSGGEKLKISIAISESLATLQKKIGFRLFDESILALDTNSLESFMSVIKILTREFNQILFISHILEVKELFDSSIKIVKNNGVSSIIK